MVPTIRALWSDGIHFVRRTSEKDRHAMRFMARAHATTTSKFSRHAPSEAAAIEIAAGATKHWLQQHPSDAAFLTEEAAPPPEASSKVEASYPPFATTLFDCTYANPVAQVWMCARWPSEMGPVGRRRAGGRPAEQTSVPHVVGECAVMKFDEVIRNPNGSVKVFPTRGHAEEAAEHLYRIEPEENTLRWSFPSVRVNATGRVEVHFDPAIYGERKPFVLYLPEYGRIIFEDTTRSTITKPGIAMHNLSPQKRLALEEARARARSEDRQPAFEEKPLRFRSIWAATDEALRREKMLRGELVV